MRFALSLLTVITILGQPLPCNAASLRQLQVADDEWGTASPAWSADSQAMVYMTWSIWGPLRILISTINAVDLRDNSEIVMNGVFALDCYYCENFYTDPAWSPDRQHITFSYSSPLIIVSIADTVASTIEGANGGQAVWSPDGSRIAFVGFLNALSVIPATGGIPTVLTTGMNPAWSPDGELLAFASNLDGNWDIWVMRLATGQLSRLTNDVAIDSEPAWSPDGLSIAFVSGGAIWIASDLSTVNVEPATWSDVKSRYR